MVRFSLLALFFLSIITKEVSSLSHEVQLNSERNLAIQDSNSLPIEAIHGIINLISWGFLIDLGLVLLRLNKGRKITIKGKIVPAQAFHSLVMSIAVLMSGVLTIIMLSRSQDEKDIQEMLYSGNNTRAFHRINGYIIGICSVIELVSGTLNMKFLEDYDRNIRSKLIITKAHKLFGMLIYLLTKVNLIVAAVFYNHKEWIVPVLVYMGVILPFATVIPSYYRNIYWTPKRIAKIVEEPSSQPKHIKLLAAINSGYAPEEVIEQFPGVKWMMLGNKVYDVTDWIHPAGNFTIEPCVGKEIGRYLYGNYALEGTRLKAHRHTALSMAQLSTFYIGKMNDPESLLISNLTKQEAFSHWNNNWKIRSIKSVSPTTSQIDLTSSEFSVKNFGTSLSWLGAHFKVSFAKDRSIARLYTVAMCLNDANYKLRQNMYQYFDDIMAGNPASYTYFSDYLTPQDHLPLFIKKYMYSKKGFSKAIHNVNPETPIRIEGPILGNMVFSPKAHGEYCIICAGTGILSIIDFLNYFLWKTIYDIIKEKAGVEKAEQINILKLPFDSMQLKIDFIGAFPNKEEILGLDIIKKLAEISNKYQKGNFTARIKGYSDENIKPLNQYFSYDFLSSNVSLNQTKYYVVGPRQLNEQVTETLVTLGVPKGRIVLL